jgi:hypothetical protein
MTPENFCYWLQGYFELNEYKYEPMTSNQVQTIQDHLDMVLDKKTPERYEKSWAVVKNVYCPLNTTHTGIKAQGLCGMVDNTKPELDKRFNTKTEHFVC